MDRDTQHLALLSHLQAIDFMSAVVLVHDPIVLSVNPMSVAYEPSVTWAISGQPRIVQTVTLYRSAIMSGTVALRALLMLLGWKASRPKDDKPSVLKRADNRGQAPGADLQWRHIDGARELTSEMLLAAAGLSIAVHENENLTHGLQEVLRMVLRATDTGVAHLVHDGAEARSLHGNIIVASAFTCIATQELVLNPSWKDAADNLVFANTRSLLPEPLASLYHDYVEDLRSDLAPILGSGSGVE